MKDKDINSDKFKVSRRAMLKLAGGSMLALPFGKFALADTAQVAGKDGTLRYALASYPPSITPWDNTGSAAGTVKLMLMRGLTGFDASGNIVGELAESWERIDDLTYQFKLRANAVFHNGKPVTSEDVKYTFSRILADDSSAYLKQDLRIIKDIQLIDAKTFNIVLSKPSATLLNVFACFDCPIISKDSTDTNFIGAGPYTFKDSERGVFIELERFDDFYRPEEPYLKTIRFVAYSDESLRYAALETGSVDVIEYVPWEKFEDAEQSQEITLKSALGPYMFLLFNCEQGPFKDPKVRQAVGFAIERQDVVDGAFAGRGKPLNGYPNPEGSAFDLSNPEVEWSFNPEKAKQLLAEAGYPNGFSCRLLSTSTYGMHQNTATIVQAYLQMIGINAQLVLPDWGTRITAGKNGDYDIAVHGMSGLFNDPESVSSLIRSSEGSFLQSHGFKSDRIDSLLEQGRSESSFQKRKAIYQELAKAYFEEVPQVPLNWRQQGFAMRSNVTGFEILPGFLNIESGYTLNKTKVN